MSEIGMSVSVSTGDLLVNPFTGRWYSQVILHIGRDQSKGETVLLDITEEVQRMYPDIEIRAVRKRGA